MSIIVELGDISLVNFSWHLSIIILLFFYCRYVKFIVMAFEVNSQMSNRSNHCQFYYTEKYIQRMAKYIGIA
jgi:hypothetical protein